MATSGELRRQTAVPLASGTVASSVAPSVNATVPVRPAAAEVTVAVNVTESPTVDGARIALSP